MNPTYILIIIIIILLIIVLWYISTYNKLKRATIKIDEALSGIDVALTKRYDVLTKIIEVVKGYAKHEKEVLFAVIKLRENMTIKERNVASDAMDKNFQKINAIAEDYPNLKADENFKMLQKTIIDVEEHLQAARRLYNSNVAIYNELISRIPSNIVANNLKMTKKEFFEANPNEKEMLVKFPN